LIDYQDAELSMQLPAYLRQKKKDIRFFEAPQSSRHTYLIHGVSIDLPSDAGKHAKQEIMALSDTGEEEELAGWRRRILRRGKPSYLQDGLEILLTLFVAATGVTLISSKVQFLLESHGIIADFSGQGDLGQFSESCKKIVLSVRSTEAGEAVTPLPRVRGANSGLGDADIKRLKEALVALPSEIAYLSQPILVAAKQDQDLLGSGDADVNTIIRSLQKSAPSGSIDRIAPVHAEILHRWLTELPNAKGAWAAPMWFIEGFLRGCAQWTH
jgi:hypothetical protein